MFYGLGIKEESNQRKLEKKDASAAFGGLADGWSLNWHLNRIDKAERADKFILAHCHPN